MYERAAVLSFIAETPLHPGQGASVGAIDLPVQRERHLGYPVIPGSSLKGVLRAQARLAWHDQPGRLTAVFGPDTEHASEHAGALAFTDARLLLFPIRSLHGVFAWATSQLTLDRYRRDLAAASLAPQWQAPAAGTASALVTPTSQLTSGKAVTLEEFTFAADPSPALAQVAGDLANNVFPTSDEYQPWRERLPGHLVLLTDNDFRDFVENATEILARIRIDQEHGTVARGGLWYEEHIPPETVFYSLALASLPRVPANASADIPRDAGGVLDALDSLPLDRLQVGGDETVGRGIVKVRVRR